MADNTTIVLFVAMKGTDAKPYAVRMRLRHNFCWCRDGRPARRPLGPGPPGGDARRSIAAFVTRAHRWSVR